MELLKIYNYDVIKDAALDISASKGKGLNGNLVKEVDAKLTSWVKEVLPQLDKTKISLVNTFGYEIEFLNYWNSFLLSSLTSGREFEALVSDWVINLSNLVMMESMVPARDGGDFHERMRPGFKIRFEACRNTGTHISLNFDSDWNFVLTKYVPKTVVMPSGERVLTGDYVVVTSREEFEDKIYEKEVEFKSGNLIVNDWFRVEGDFEEAFSKMVEDTTEDGDWSARSLNHLKGIIRSITRYADLNFVSVNVGNSSPGVYEVGGMLIVGSGEQSHEQGSVCTDLWNATMIDEVDFLEFMKKAGMSEAQALVEIEVQKNLGMSLKVEPGIYKLSFCGESEDFNAKYEVAHPGKIPEGYEALFILEKK